MNMRFVLFEMFGLNQFIPKKNWKLKKQAKKDI